MNFYLRTTKSAQTTILLKSWYHQGNRLPFVFSTGETIAPEDWDPKTKQAKESRKHPNGITTNAILRKYKEAATTYITHTRSTEERSPTHQELRTHLTTLKNKITGADQTIATTQPQLTFTQYLHHFQQRLKETRSYNYAKGFGILVQNLELYQKTKRKIDWQDLTMQFYQDWQQWNISEIAYDKHHNIIKDQLAQSTIAGYWKRLKTALEEAAHDGHQFSEDHKRKSLAIADQESGEVFLDIEDLTAIYNLKDLTPELEIHRDLALLNAFAAGWRFADLHNAESANIVPINSVRTLQFWTKKTDDELLVPASWYWEEFSLKYKARWPKKVNEQFFNRNLKRICRLAGLTHPTTLRKNKGGKNILITKPKCDWVHQYTLRYSFATNLAEAGLPVEHIQQLMGHARIETTLRYIKSKKRRAVKKAAENPFFSQKPAVFG